MSAKMVRGFLRLLGYIILFLKLIRISRCDFATNFRPHFTHGPLKLFHMGLSFLTGDLVLETNHYLHKTIE